MASKIDTLTTRFEANTIKFEEAIKRLTKANFAFADKIKKDHTKAASDLNAIWDKADLGKSLKAGSAGLSEIGATAGRVAPALAALFSIDQMQQFTDAFIRVNNQLKVAGLEGGNLTAVYGVLMQQANNAGVSIEALGTLYGKASQTATALGASQGQLLKFTSTVSTALKVSGTDAQGAAGALLQLSQALGSGTVHAEEFNSVQEGMPALLLAAAQASNKYKGNVAALKQDVVAQKVTSKEFFDMILAGSAILNNQASKATQTFGQGLEVLKNKTIDYVGKLDETYGIQEKFAAGLTFLADHLDEVGKVAEIVALAFATKMAVGMAKSTAEMWKNAEAATAQAIQLKASKTAATETAAATSAIGAASATGATGVTALATATRVFGAALKSIAILAAISLITDMITSSIKLRETQEDLIKTYYAAKTATNSASQSAADLKTQLDEGVITAKEYDEAMKNAAGGTSELHGEHVKIIGISPAAQSALDALSDKIRAQGKAWSDAALEARGYRIEAALAAKTAAEKAVKDASHGSSNFLDQQTAQNRAFMGADALKMTPKQMVEGFGQTLSTGWNRIQLGAADLYEGNNGATKRGNDAYRIAQENLAAAQKEYNDAISNTTPDKPKTGSGTGTGTNTKKTGNNGRTQAENRLNQAIHDEIAARLAIAASTEERYHTALELAEADKKAALDKINSTKGLKGKDKDAAIASVNAEYQSKVEEANQRYAEDMKRQQDAINNAVQGRLSSEMAIAQTAKQRHDIALRQLEIDNDAAIASIQANKDLDSDTKSRLLMEQYGKNLADAKKEEMVYADESAQEAYDHLQSQQKAAEIDEQIYGFYADVATTQKERVDWERKALESRQQRELALAEAQLKIIEATNDQAQIEAAKAAIEKQKQANKAETDSFNKQNADPLTKYKNEDLAYDPATAFGNAQVDALSNLEDGLVGIIGKTKTAKEAWHDLAQGVVEDIARIIVKQALIKPIANMFTGQGDSVAANPTAIATSGSSGSSGILGAVGSLLGGGSRGNTAINPIYVKNVDGASGALSTAASLASSASGSGGLFSSLGHVLSGIGHIFGFSNGTDNFPGGLAYVHQGELVNMPKGSSVTRANDVEKMLRNAQRTPNANLSQNMSEVHLHTTVNANDAVLTNTVQSWIAQSHAMAVQQAQNLTLDKLNKMNGRRL